MKYINKTIKPISVLLIFTFVFLSSAKPAHAIPVWDFKAFVQRLIDNFTQGSQAVSGGVSATVDTATLSKSLTDNLSSAVQSGVLEAAEAVCDDVLDSAQLATSLFDIAKIGLQSVGGDLGEVLNLYLQTKLTQTQLACFYKIRFATRTVSAARVGQLNAELNRTWDAFINRLDNKIQIAKKRSDDLGADKSFSTKEMFKSILTGVVVNLIGNVTEKYTQKLVARYKVNNFLSYSNLLASQVYAIDSIRQNYNGDPKQQVLTRAMLQSSLLNLPGRKKIVDGFIDNKLASLGVLPADRIKEDRPNLLTNLSRLGDSRFGLFLDEADRANDALNQGRASAAAEVASGQGFMGARSCGESLSFQKTVDQEALQISKELVLRQKVAKEARLLESAIKNKTDDAEKGYYFSILPDDEVASRLKQARDIVRKADAEANKVQLNLNNMPTRHNKLVYKTCEALTAPPAFAKFTTEKYASSYLDRAFNTQSENLPLFAKLISKYAANFVGKFLEKGPNGKGTSVLTDQSLGFEVDSDNLPGISRLSPIVVEDPLRTDQIGEPTITVPSPITVNSKRDIVINLNTLRGQVSFVRMIDLEQGKPASDDIKNTDIDNTTTITIPVEFNAVGTFRFKIELHKQEASVSTGTNTANINSTKLFDSGELIIEVVSQSEVSGISTVNNKIKLR